MPSKNKLKKEKKEKSKSPEKNGKKHSIDRQNEATDTGLANQQSGTTYCVDRNSASQPAPVSSPQSSSRSFFFRRKSSPETNSAIESSKSFSQKNHENKHGSVSPVLGDEKISVSLIGSEVKSNPTGAMAQPPLSPQLQRLGEHVTENKNGLENAGDDFLEPSERSRKDSISSTVSGVSVATVASAVYQGDRPKLTLGEIVRQLEVKCNALLQREDFTTDECSHDLGFVTHQSRYSSDIHIKRKLVTKMVECGILDIFLKVFKSVHTVDYFKSNGDSRNSQENTQPDQETTNGIAAKTCAPIMSDALKNLRSVTTLILNTSDKSPLLCEECIRKGVIRLLFQDLTDTNLAVAELKDQNRLHLVKGYLGILNNIIRCHSEVRDMYRDSGAVKILQQYVKSSLLIVKTKAVMLLSYVINESENDIIFSTEKNLIFIIKMLQASLEADNHYSKKYGYWAVEILAGLNRLATCESNKERILKKGVLPLYAKLLQPCCSDEEQMIASQGLWVFAFNEECKGLIHQEPGCLEGLEALEQNSPREEIRRTARGALWVILGKQSTHKASPTASGGAIPKSDGHVMISYSWSTKPTMLKIRDRLKASGYKVWMDVDNMTGSTMESMANAIENAAVVLVCLCQKYKDSPACRTEAEYTFKLKRDIVPLRVQIRYNPDGWLGLMVGTKMYFDFSREENLDMMMTNLIRELGNRGRCKTVEAEVCRPVASHPMSSQVSSPYPIRRHPQPTHMDPGTVPASGVSQWSVEDVAEWLAEHGLTDCKQKFREVNGELLLEIRKMLKNAPEAFYATVKSELKCDFVTTLRLTKALDKLM